MELEWDSVKNNCFYCRSAIGIKDLEEQLKTGILHIHYCNNCVQVCESSACVDPIRPIYAFPYNQQSDAYQKWIMNDRLPFPAPREAHAKVCSLCERTEREDQRREREAKKLAKLVTPANKRLLQGMRALKAARGAQEPQETSNATERPATPAVA